MLQLFKKEINSFLNSFIAYVIMGVFLVSLGLLTWVFPETNILDSGYAELNVLFSLSPYVFMFLIPAITMRMFAEEKKSGTIELLLTQPLSLFEIIIGKLLASWVLVLFTLSFTLIYYFSVKQLGSPIGNIDSASTFGSYIGLSLLALVFVSIGLFTSSVSDNQIVSFVLAVFISFLAFMGISSLSSLESLSKVSLQIEELGIESHYLNMSKGLIDSRDVLYFLSFTTIMLILSKLTLQSKKW